MARHTVTLREIARRAGVHESTVSRALNERTRHLVADPVAVRIAATARELGYRPNVMAAALRTRRSRAVGLILDDLADPAHAASVAAIEATLRAAGYALTVAATHGDAAQLSASLDAFAGRGVDGAILLDRMPPDAAKDDGALDLPLVTPLDFADPGEAGVGLAVAELARLGHRAIGHLAGPAGAPAGRARLAGFRRAMTTAGLFATAIEACMSFSIEAGRHGAARLLARRPNLTALVGADDRLALGALDALAAAGRDCPGAVSVTGLGDLPLTGRVTPALTTVAFDAAAVGRRAAMALLARLDAGATDLPLLPPTVLLIARGSSGPAPAAAGPAAATD